jgi:CheY-like chemotaxis protein
MKPSSDSVIPIHLLLVDDNKSGLNARKAVLEELHYKVTALTSHVEALERLSSEKFDLLITDYKMPGMSGVELILRSRAMGRTTPTILLSGFVDGMGLDTKTTGADVVLQKSSNEVSHMVRSVRALLRAKQSPAKKPAGRQSGAAKAGRKQA